MTEPAVRIRAGRSSAGRLGLLLVASAASTPLLVRVHATGGYDIAPFPLCPFHAVTGWWCPLCGSVRAVAALTRLDPVAALSSNVLVTPLLVLGLCALLAWGLAPVVDLRLRPVEVPHRAWIALGVLSLLFTVWRNLPALPLGAWLAP